MPQALFFPSGHPPPEAGVTHITAEGGRSPTLRKVIAGIEVIPDLAKQPKCKAFSVVIFENRSYKNHIEK